jgi:acyl-CoA synthetase (AMP-forming)/AMP-acid ligase II
LATAAYLDAKFLIRNDLKAGSVKKAEKKSAQFIVERFEQGKALVYDYFEEHALGKNSDNICLICEDKTWTYKQLYDGIQRVGNWLMKDLQVQRGEVVALDGPNSPEYVMFVMAISAIGASAAYINNHLTATPMVHSVKLCEARYLLTDREVQPLVQPCEGELRDANVQTIYFDEVFISTLPDTTPIPAARRENVNPAATLRLIYTSGTTGLPKGVKQTYGRELLTAEKISQHLNLKPGVRMYTCLPIYHVSGHGLCVIPCLYAGATIVLGRKFSHKTFWPAVRSSRAEIIQYVGELARYLLSAPPSPLDKQHNVHMAWGNGIRPDVWEPFRQRFGIDTINEIYGATDGFSTTWNKNRGEFGATAISVRGPLWHFRNGAREKRILIDVDSEEVVRDANGFAIACKAGEAGECIHKVDPEAEALVFSKYYKNEAAGSKRKLRDVFQKGDLWFRTGDLMRADADGRLFFVDRLGDTFRWRSENVSTNEVGEVLAGFDQIQETNVYGVLVPHADGRAGCAAIVAAPGVKEIDWARLAAFALANLPRYAVPIFIRVVTELEYTATNKLQKGRLRAEGADLDKIHASSPNDVMYWLPLGASKYIPYQKADWEALQGGNTKL